VRILCNDPEAIFRVFQLFFQEVKYFYQKKTWKNSQIIFIWWKWFKRWTNFGKEFASEGVEAVYIARTIFIFYSYLKLRLVVSGSCNPSHRQRFMQRSFSKVKLLKKIPRNSMTSERLGNVDLCGVSRVWQAWHMPWAPLWRGAQKVLGKSKIFIYSFLNLCFVPHAFINCKTASTPRPHLKHYVGRVVLAPLNIMTKLRYCDITRGSDIATEQERSLAMSTRPRPSHTIRKDKSVRTAAAAFQASRY